MMRNGSGSSSTSGLALSRFESLLLREIEKSAAMILRDPGLKAPMPRFRVVSPQGECLALYDRERVRQLMGGLRKARLEKIGAAIIIALGAFVQSKGASHCIYVTTADVPDLPKAVVAVLVDRQTGKSWCLGRQVFLRPTRLGPVAEIPIEDVPEGPDIVCLLLRDHSLEDAQIRKMWELVLDDGVIRVVEEEPWVIVSDRLPH